MAGEAYLRKGTSKLVSGQAGADVALSAEGISNNAGRVSAQIDWGAQPRPALYEWSCEVQWAATPTSGLPLDLYIAGAPDDDSTQIDGDIGAVDAQLADSDMRKNLMYIGSVISENSAANEKCVASGTFFFPQRYMSIVVYNAGGSNLHSTDTLFRFNIVPIYWQVQ